MPLGQPVARIGRKTVGGGASLIDSNGATLGAVPAIDTTKFLTADNQIYFSDGSLWRPFTNPNWPRRDGASDEEWEGTADTLPAAWTQRVSTGVAIKINSELISNIVVKASAPGGAGSYIISRAVPGAPNKTYAARVIPQASYPANANGCCGLIVAGGTAANKQLIVGFLIDNTVSNAIVGFNFSNWAFSSSLFTTYAKLGISYNSPHIIAFTSDGTNLVFKYGTDQGGEGCLTEFFTTAIATWIGTFDYFGIFLGAQTVTGVVGSRAICDWIRVF